MCWTETIYVQNTCRICRLMYLHLCMTWHADRASLSIAPRCIRNSPIALYYIRNVLNFDVCKNQSQESTNNTDQSGVN